MDQDNGILRQLQEKYEALGEKTETYLQGLLQSKPITYWDYVELDTLLSLQRPRTPFKDEEIFIMYHQVTELTLKMMLLEIRQLVEKDLPVDTWVDKLGRLNRYTGLLINSFDIMRSGMSYDDYNTFRPTLAPASGFQSHQFRLIEIYCTRLENLVNEEGKKRLPTNPAIEDYFEHIYWKDAGHDRKTGKKTLTLRLFEEKYLDLFVRTAQKTAGYTLEEKIMRMGTLPPALSEALLAFDNRYNVDWPMTHLQTAQHYLDSKGETKAATGGSEWKKYLHPKYQQRRFFPEINTA